MIRRLFALFALLPFFIFTLSPVTFAQSQRSDEQEKIVVLPRNETVNHNYYAAGNTVTVSGTVNGDAFIAGGTVLIEGTVNGDLLVAGGTVTVDGKVTQNIRAAGGDIQVNGSVGRNISAVGGTIVLSKSASISGSLVTVGGNVQVLTPIKKTLDAASGQLTVGNSVNGDVQASVGQLTFSPEASVSGNVTYWSNTDASMQSGSQVAGSIKHFHFPSAPVNRTGIAQTAAAAAILGKLYGVLFYVLIGLAFVFFFPNFMTGVATAAKTRPWPAVAWGLLATALMPALFIILCLTVIGIPLAFMLVIYFIIVAVLSKVFIALTIGEVIAGYAKTKMHMAWMYILGLLVYEIVKLIPVIGVLASITVFFMGIGALLIEKKRLYTVLRKDKYI